LITIDFINDIIHPADCCAAASVALHEQCLGGTLARLANVIDSSALPA
jgi:hypothetical protein